MADKNENEVLSGAETSQENTTPAETLTAPGEQPGQMDTPPQENPAPGISRLPRATRKTLSTLENL